MRTAHQYWKMVVIGFVLIAHLTIGFLAKFFLYGARRRAFHISMLQRNSRVVLAVLGVQLRVIGDQNWRPGQNYVVVANHLSYLDTLLFAAYKPACFISSVEIRETPFLGRIVESCGVIFVERRSRKNIPKEIGYMETVLKEGFSLMLFPEATSTNGAKVLDFKRAFFAPCQRQGIPVLPAVVQLEELDGEKITTANRDTLCWYGEMQLAAHLFALAGHRHAIVALKILPEISVSETNTRDELAEQAHAAIVQNYRPIS